MESGDLSAQERLDRMLHDGTITEEDYLRLSRVVDASGGTKEMQADAKVRKLTKKWDGGLVGGICAGYADYFGVDVAVVRTITVLAAILLLGVLALPLYLLGCLFVPWDDAEKARAFRESGRPKAFMVAVACLFFVFPWVYATFALPYLEAVYEDVGFAIWSASGQMTWAGRALDCASEYRGWVSRVFWTPVDHAVISLVVIALAASLVLVLGALYNCMCRECVRKWFARGVVWLGIGWCLFLFAGTMYPLIGMTARMG